MADDFLSQEEVDALLRGVDGGGEDAADGAQATGGAVRPYNLASQDRILRERMPTMEVIHDRFARSLRPSLFEFVRRSLEVSAGAVRLVKYGEFLRSLIAPTNLNVMQMKPLRGHALFVLDPGLVYTIVDSMFGSDGRFPARADGREFTPTELRIIQRLLRLVNDEYQRAWQPVHPLQFEYVRSESHAPLANIATPADVVVATTFSIQVGTGGGELHICIPYASVEPIRDRLCSAETPDHGAPDSRWLRLLSSQLQAADVELVAQLAEALMPVRRLTGLQVGDVIPLELRPTIVASVDGVPVLEGKYGTLNGRYAFKVDRLLARQREEQTVGEENVR